MADCGEDGRAFDGSAPSERSSRKGRSRRPRLEGVEARYELKSAPRRKARWQDAPLPGPRARPITPLMIDGGTKFACFVDRELWHPRFDRFIEFLLDEQRKRVDPLRVVELEPLPNMLLPLPTLPVGYQRGLASIGEHEPSIDYTTRGFGHTGATGAPVAIVGIEGMTITLHFRDRAFIRLMRRNDGDGDRRWYILVEAKHRELYARGLDAWLRSWLGIVSWWCSGQWLEPHQLREFGWGTTQLHVNADFVHVDFVPEDALDVTSIRMRTLIGRKGIPEDVALVENDDDDGEDEPPPGWCQTWQYGRRASDVCIVGYKKGDEQRQAKGIDPAASAYAVWWRKFGNWDQELDGDPFRVEARFRKKGLLYLRDGTDEVLYDFRDPAVLLDEVALQTLWRNTFEKRRLVIRKRAKLRDNETDPRWKIVMDAAGYESRPAIRQVPHEVAKLTRVERVLKARREVFDALQDLALIENGIGIVDPMDFAAALRELADRVASREVKVDRLGDGVLAHAWEPAKVVKRKPAKVEFFSEELVPRVPLFHHALRVRGGPGGTSVFEILGPPIERGSTTNDREHNAWNDYAAGGSADDPEHVADDG